MPEELKKMMSRQASADGSEPRSPRQGEAAAINLAAAARTMGESPAPCNFGPSRPSTDWARTHRTPS